MDIPTSFSMPPGESQHKYFRNLCIEFKKLVKKSDDLDLLQFEMEKLINASKQINWEHKSTDKFKKDKAEKTLSKVWTEFDRYFMNLKDNKDKSNMQDLLDAIEEVESLISEQKID